MPFSSATTYFHEHDLDLNSYLQPHPLSTYFFRMEGNALEHIGIFNDDILTVDRSLNATNGNLIIAELNGELIARRLLLQNGKPTLSTDNPQLPPYHLSSDDTFAVWGVVTSVIRKLL